MSDSIRGFEQKTGRSRRHLGAVLTAMVLGGVLLSVFAGCSGSKTVIATTPEEAYNRGKDLFDQGKFRRSAEQLLSVFDFGRAHEYAADAQFLLGQAYFNHRQYLLAATEFERFANLYRTDPRVQEADYQHALSMYEQSPPVDLDQTDTERAITSLRLFIEKYPSSEKADEAGALIDELQAKMANKLFLAATLYERQQYNEAAAITYLEVLNKYPSSRFADDALVGSMRAHMAYSAQSIDERKAERLQKAIETYHRLVELFPDSDLVKDAESLYTVAQERMETILATAG